MKCYSDHMIRLWRSQRKGKAKTPDHLKAMAISLLAKYSISDVCNRLAAKHLCKLIKGLSQKEVAKKDPLD